METKDILMQLASKRAISGYEKEISDFVADLFRAQCDEVRQDAYFNVLAKKCGNTVGEDHVTCKAGKRPSIMICAHMDEIGFVVKSIKKGGFVSLATVGGQDPKVLMAQEVTIHGKKDVYGVVGAKPPHLMKENERGKMPPADMIYVDTGMSEEALKALVSIGDAVTFDAYPVELFNGRIASKSLDNRTGVAVLFEVLQCLQKQKHAFDVWFAATVQEEVNTSGAGMVAWQMDPTLAVVVDTTFGDINDCPKDKCFGLGRGPAIGMGANMHRNMTERMISIAREENIPWQLDIEPEDSGTDAWQVQVSRAGIATLLVSVPLRYMHSTTETVELSDIKMTGRLIARFIASLDELLVKDQENGGMEAVLCE